jgi:hypothetical protein
MMYYWSISVTILTTNRGFCWQWKWNGWRAAIKSLFTPVDWDTGNPLPFWTTKRGEQFDYTHAQLITPPSGVGLFGLAPIKPEGAPIQYDSEFEYWIGTKYLGTWWSVKFRTRWFNIYYRHRSWARDIFYIAKD